MIFWRIPRNNNRLMSLVYSFHSSVYVQVQN